ncbi:hypothetical protein TNCV_2539091 [Trichonephila clavipes]|nr:hypothetical protein TNCV_2539091 [Trichonephila clavipes]
MFGICWANELQPVNPLPPVYRNFGGHCLMSGVDQDQIDHFILSMPRRYKLWKSASFDHPDYSRSLAEAAVRPAVTHDYLYVNIHGLQIVSRPAYPLCSIGSVMNAEQLPVCSDLSQNYVFARN